MAIEVRGKALGGAEKVFQDGVETVQDVFNKLELNGSYTATVNGEPAEMSDELPDYAYVAFAEAVKGGC